MKGFRVGLFAKGGKHMDAAANSYRRFLDGDESAFEEIMQELFCGLVFFINGFVHDPHLSLIHI